MADLIKEIEGKLSPEYMNDVFTWKQIKDALESATNTTSITARQFAVKAIHEDKLNVRNPSILAKLLKEYTDLKNKT